MCSTALTNDRPAFYDGLDDGGKRLFDIITDPDNDQVGYADGDDRASQIQCLSEFGGYEGCDAYFEARQVFDRLRAHYENSNPNAAGVGDPSFGFDRDNDGGTGGYNVSIHLGAAHEGTSLVSFHDTTYLPWDRDATGLSAAVSYARTLDGEIQRLTSIAHRAGLLAARAGDDDAPTPDVAARR